MHNRPRNWLLAAGAVAVAWIAQPIWSRNLDYFVEKRGWEKTLDTAVGSMSEWMTSALALLRLDGFWGGAFTVLAIWGCLECVYAVHRKRRGLPNLSAQVSVSQGVYVARVGVAATKLTSDHLLEFSLIVFNGTGSALRLLLPVQGRVAYGGKPDASDADVVALPPSVLREDNPVEIASYAELMIIIEQRVPGELAAEMDRALSDGGRVRFILSGLNIRLQSEGQDQAERLPVWDQITCFPVISTELGPMLHVGRIITATVNTTIGTG